MLLLGLLQSQNCISSSCWVAGHHCLQFFCQDSVTTPDALQGDLLMNGCQLSLDSPLVRCNFILCLLLFFILFLFLLLPLF